jgi:hypothetical protein
MMNPSDTLLRATADTMKATGLWAAGYRYVRAPSLRAPALPRPPCRSPSSPSPAAPLTPSQVNLDDGMVEAARDAQGNLVADTRGFPNGLKATSDYLHSQGFLFGVYTDRGPQTW